MFIVIERLSHCMGPNTLRTFPQDTNDLIIFIVYYRLLPDSPCRALFKTTTFSGWTK